MKRKPEPRYRNHYFCRRCALSWTDDWSAMCNDKCDGCGREIEPEMSEDLEDEDEDTVQAADSPG